MRYLYILAFIVLGGCAVYTPAQDFRTAYQLITLKGIQDNVASDNMMFEGKDLNVKYYFWAENGDGAMGVYNKTEKFIYWQVDESFFINNGVSNEYYSNAVVSTTRNLTLTSNLYWLYGYSDGAGITNGQTVTTTQQKVIIIPPGAWKAVLIFPVLTTPIISSGSVVPIRGFDKNNTPANIFNIISYKVDGNDTLRRFKNELYVSEMHSYLEPEFIKSVSGKQGNGAVSTKKMVYEAANKFYIKHHVPAFGFCSYGTCNTKECKNCASIGSAYCPMHMDVSGYCSFGDCRYKLNGVTACGKCATDERGFCETHK